MGEKMTPPRFYIRAFDEAGNLIMSSIQVTMPEDMVLSEPSDKWSTGRAVSPYAVAHALGYITQELARYGLSECLLSVEASALRKATGEPTGEG